MAWRAVVDAKRPSPASLSGVWLPRRMMEYRERTWCQKQTAGTLFGFGTSLNCQQVWSALSQLTYSQPTTQKVARRAPIYPSRLQAIDTSNSSASARKNERLLWSSHFTAYAGDPVPEMRQVPRDPVPRLLYVRGAGPRAQAYAEASQPVREALQLEPVWKSNYGALS